jgi:dienelactone hydrolase
MTRKTKQSGSAPPLREDIPGSQGHLELRRRAVLKALGRAAIIGGASLGLWHNRGRAASLEGGQDGMGVLRSSEQITTDTAVAIFGRHRVEGTRALIRHDVDVYRVTYATRDAEDKEVVASGAVLIPKVPKAAGKIPLMCYCRGTIIPVYDEYTAPSYYDLRNNESIYQNYGMSFLAASFASAGYLVAAPDGIGYGATKGHEHPYVHAPSLARTSLDLLRAACELAARNAVDLDRRVFITGWSEGGLAGMALHKLIEDTCREELSVAASSLLAGAYALTAMVDLFCNYDEDYPEYQIYFWGLRSMARVHKLKRPFDRIVVPPFAAALAKDVLADAPKNPRIGLDPNFRDAYLNDPGDEMRRALRDSDRYDWKPLAPVFLHHGTRDDIVPFFASQMAYEAMRARGSRVNLYPYLGKDHYQPVNTYVTRSLADFASLRN